MNLGKDEASAGPFGCSSDCLAICVHELREMVRSPRPPSLGNSTPELGIAGKFERRISVSVWTPSSGPCGLPIGWAEGRVVDSNRRLLL